MRDRAVVRVLRAAGALRAADLRLAGDRPCAGTGGCSNAETADNRTQILFRYNFHRVLPL